MKKLIIGIAGKLLAGKGTCAGLIKLYDGPIGIYHIQFSDVIRETLDLWFLPRTRANQQFLPRLLMEGFKAPAILSNVAKERTLRSAARIVIQDGLRWPSDMEMFQALPHEKILLYVTASPRTRFERLLSRQEKTGEQTTTWDEFLAQDQAQNEVFIDQIGLAADYTIGNEGSQEALREKIGIFWTLKVEPLLPDLLAS